jgi:hypothetical protein
MITGSCSWPSGGLSSTEVMYGIADPGVTGLFSLVRRRMRGGRLAIPRNA